MDNKKSSRIQCKVKKDLFFCMLKKIISNVDSWLCEVYDLKKSVVAQAVNINTQEIVVTSVHKRWREKTNLKKVNLNDLTVINQKELGDALGSTIAQNLNIHFTHEK